jgi:hypothetical protein
MSKPIIIKGRTAKAIYDQILKHDKDMEIINDGDERNPVLRVEAD